MFWDAYTRIQLELGQCLASNKLIICNNCGVIACHSADVDVCPTRRGCPAARCRTLVIGAIRCGFSLSLCGAAPAPEPPLPPPPPAASDWPTGRVMRLLGTAACAYMEKCPPLLPWNVIVRRSHPVPLNYAAAAAADGMMIPKQMRGFAASPSKAVLAAGARGLENETTRPPSGSHCCHSALIVPHLCSRRRWQGDWGLGFAAHRETDRQQPSGIWPRAGRSGLLRPEAQRTDSIVPPPPPSNGKAATQADL